MGGPSRTQNTTPNNKGSVSLGHWLPDNYKVPEGQTRPPPSSQNVARQHQKVSKGFAVGFDMTLVDQKGNDLWVREVIAPVDEKKP